MQNELASALVYPLYLDRPLRPQFLVELPGYVQGQLGEPDRLQVADDGHHDALGRRVVPYCRGVDFGRGAAAAFSGNDEEDAGSADGAAGVKGTKFLKVTRETAVCAMRNDDP